MARKRRRGGRRGLPKTAGGWVSLGFKATGAVIALGPAIAGVTANIGDPGNIPRAVAHGYTGVDISNPSAGIDFGALGGGVASVAGGIIVAKIGSMLGRIIH